MVFIFFQFTNSIFFHICLGAGKVPSSAFCLMVRLLTLRCTEKQMKTILGHPDSPYIRCIGFLYLRYAADPYSLFSWFQPYLYDEEIVRISTSQNVPEMTIGEYVRSLLTDMNYHGTLLPRLPNDREMKVKLLQEEEIENRALSHLKNKKYMDYFQTIGCNIRALYGDEENPTTWYDCVVDRVLRRDDETGIEYIRPKYIVTFTGYGNTEIVTLGEIDMRLNDAAPMYRDERYRNNQNRNEERSSFRSRSNNDREYTQNEQYRSYSDRGYRQGNRNYNNERSNDRNTYSNYEKEDDYSWKRDRYDNSKRDDYHDQNTSSSRRDKDEKELMEEVLRREKEKCTSKGKDYARKPPTCKSSLSGQQAGSSGWARTKMNEKNVRHGRDRQDRKKRDWAAANPEKNNQEDASQSKKNETMKTPEEIAAIEEKKRKLLERYG